MAFAIAGPISDEGMVAVFDVKWLISRQGHENRPQAGIECGPVLPFGFSLKSRLKAEACSIVRIQGGH